MKAREIINTTVAATKKGNRIWLEGIKLNSLGFTRGSKYSRILEDGVITLSTEENGPLKVSGKRRNGGSVPVIDLCGKWLEEVFSEGDLITAKIEDGKISIKLHKEGQAQRVLEESLLTSPVLRKGVLCYGIGVSGHAFQKALDDIGVDSRLELVAEREAKYLQVASKNNNFLTDGTLMLQGDLERVDVDDLPNLDILSMSLPCTGHSPAGKTSNKISSAEEHKDAATAVFGAMKIIYKTNPSVIISENVVQARNSATYSLIKAELARLGYTVFEAILGIEESNALENRNRYWFVAISSKISRNFDLEDLKQYVGEKPYHSIGDLIEDDGPQKFFSPEKFLKREAENKAKGRGFKTQFVTREGTSVNVIPRNYSKRQVSNPHYLEDGKVRLFNSKEHARLKGIPEKLVEGISETTAHEGLGQSILYSHAYAIGRRVAELIIKLREEYSSEQLEVVA